MPAALMHAAGVEGATPGDGSRWPAPPGAAPTGLGLKDRLLTSPRFRRWAAAFPLTRPIARRRAGALFDLCAGFVYAQVLAACVQLRVFDLLAAGPRGAADLAEAMALPPDAAETLLAAAVSLRLLARRHGRFGLGPLGAAMIGNDGLAAMVAHHALLYADLQDPVRLLREGGAGGQLSAYWPYACGADAAALPPARIGAYTALMAASQPMIADEILASYDFGRHRHVLDVGGGDGSFTVALAARHAGLALTVFDLPAVAAAARQRFEQAGLSARAHAVGGDFRTGELPGGADIVTLVRVAHDHNDADLRRLLRAIHTSLPPGGTILLAEPMAETPGAARMGDAYFGFYLLAMGRGRPRSASLYQAMLLQAGFQAPRLRPTAMPMLTQVIVAAKP